MGSISSFRDLDVWKNGHILVISIYKITQTFPNSEQFGLTNQIRRACVSITSNIVEGFVRKNKKEKIQFYYIALGSLTEVKNQLQIALDISYIDRESYLLLEEQTDVVGRLLNSLIRSTQNRSF